jgi:hypothetical protein
MGQRWLCNRKLCARHGHGYAYKRAHGSLPCAMIVHRQGTTRAGQASNM